MRFWYIDWLTSSLELVVCTSSCLVASYIPVKGWREYLPLFYFVYVALCPRCRQCRAGGNKVLKENNTPPPYCTSSNIHRRCHFSAQSSYLFGSFSFSGSVGSGSCEEVLKILLFLFPFTAFYECAAVAYYQPCLMTLRLSRFLNFKLKFELYATYRNYRHLTIAG